MFVDTEKKGSMTGRYIGPVDSLFGETALLRESRDPHVYYAQFDRTDVHAPGAPAVLLGYGWHVFAASDFAVTFTDLLTEAEGPDQQEENAHAATSRQP